ncbi:hypothetical protein ACLMAJ_32315 [Nocardia sp. KC 131]|uniref:hypothetical protein n=1 Tax=Nocardia arseniciresistens TaxID=3392119 RepID=UPI00398F0BB2
MQTFRDPERIWLVLLGFRAARIDDELGPILEHANTFDQPRLPHRTSTPWLGNFVQVS